MQQLKGILTMFNFPPINPWRNTTTSGTSAATGISPVSTSGVGRGAALTSSSMRAGGVSNKTLSLLGHTATLLGITALGGLAIRAAFAAWLNRPLEQPPQLEYLKKVSTISDEVLRKTLELPESSDARDLRRAASKVQKLAWEESRPLKPNLFDEEQLDNGVRTVNAAIDEYDKVLASLREKGLALDEEFTFERPPI